MQYTFCERYTREAVVVSITGQDGSHQQQRQKRVQARSRDECAAGDLHHAESRCLGGPAPRAAPRQFCSQQSPAERLPPRLHIQRQVMRRRICCCDAVHRGNNNMAAQPCKNKQTKRSQDQSVRDVDPPPTPAWQLSMQGTHSHAPGGAYQQAKSRYA